MCCAGKLTFSNPSEAACYGFADCDDGECIPAAGFYCPSLAPIADCDLGQVGCDRKCEGHEHAECVFNACGEPYYNGEALDAGMCTAVYVDPASDEVIEECLNLTQQMDGKSGAGCKGDTDLPK